MRTELYTELIGGIDAENLVSLLKAMISIRSENPFDEEPRDGFREKEMAEYFLGQMECLGLEVSSRDVRPGRPNVFGLRKGVGNGPTLMLGGHMDTATTDNYPDAYEMKVEDGKVFGRGSCDMKAALASYLEVVRIIKEADLKLRGDLIVAGIVDEEFQMLGSKDIGANGPRADQGIIGEPSEMTICPANKGCVRAIIRTFGKAVHSSVPEQGDNAIMRMVKVLEAFSTYNEELLQREPHGLCGHGRFNPGVIRAGVQVNIVPDRCDLEIDRRTLPGETKEQVYEEWRKRLEHMGQDDPSFRYEITDPTWLIPPNDISPEEPVVLSLVRAYDEVMGHRTQPLCWAAGTDAPHMGFPTVICGPGSISQAHTTREFVAAEQLVLAVKMYLWTILDLLG
jgi:acetylornithine deacetylase/succinyl-diaminopimelate desuccinylase family protein